MPASVPLQSVDTLVILGVNESKLPLCKRDAIDFWYWLKVERELLVHAMPPRKGRPTSALFYMNLRASSTFRPVDLSRAMQAIVPALVEAVRDSCNIVTDEAQMLAAFQTGDLISKIHTGGINTRGTAVEGSVVSDSEHAGFVEFGTGLRGMGTYPGELPQTGVPITGSWIYDYKKQNWIGMPAQPYLRPALDNSGTAILGAFAARGFRL
jgi:hypothetical protein